MNKTIKILIIGLGSIGQRHYKNLKKLGYANLYVYDVVAVKDKQINIVDEISQPVLRQFDVVFVCSPNNLHIKHALMAAKAGCHLFIEKPLSHSLNNVEKLKKICGQKKLINMVACNMRFHPCLQFIKNYLEKNRLGKIYSIYHEFGYYLPYWRPGTDYKKNYAARKAEGGGIILDDIHEFDLLFWLNDFSKVKDSQFIFNKASDLEIETEDNCIASFKFNNKALGSVMCDYLQQYYSRSCKIIGEKGNLEWDWNENIVWLRNKAKNKKLFRIKNYDLNQMYIDEIKYFLNCIDKKHKIFNDIKTAQAVLKYCVKRK